MSGGLATVSHWLVMALMIKTGTPAFTATGVGAFVGSIVNYFLQRNLTFQSKTPHRIALLRYAFVCLQTWITNLLFFYLLHHIALLNTVYSQVLTTITVSLLSYFLYKRVVFYDH